MRRLIAHPMTQPRKKKVGDLLTCVCVTILSMTDIDFISGAQELLDEVGPLWEKLNRIHGDQSLHFAHGFHENVFSGRKAGLVQKAKTGKILIELAQDDGHNIGYCVTTINRAHIGELESVFVENDYRGQKIGKHLVQSSLDWMDKHKVKSKYLVVAGGNEKVIGFYEKFNFYPSNTTLTYKG